MTLVAEGIVHRDLALRSVLLSEPESNGGDKVSVKVSGFVLLLNVYGGAHQTVVGGPTSVRNMASKPLAKERYSELRNGNPLHTSRIVGPKCSPLAESLTPFFPRFTLVWFGLVCTDALP